MTVPAGPLHTTAVVLAAGTGERVGLGTPKQLVKIAGKTILEHAVTVFELAPGIDDIVVMMAPGYVDEAERIIDKAGLTKVSHVLEGGASRNATTRRALDALTARLPAGGDQNVVLHDAARPLLSQRIIADCLTALETYRAVDVAIPSADTVVVTRPHGGDGEWITDIPDRRRLRRGQTPQAFRLSTLREAYARAAEDANFAASDDCSVVLTYTPEVPVDVVAGDEHNMKITEPVDIHLADRLFQLSSYTVPPRPDPAGYRKLLADKTMVVFGGSSGIGADLTDLAEHHGARVFPHSRSTTGTRVERAGDVERALAEAYERTGRIDFVVNTAAILRIGKLADSDDALARETLEVNYLGPVHIARAAHPYLTASKGHLLLFTSSSYTRGRADYSLYSSAKAAMVNLVQALADEWADDGIRTNCVNPERTRTPMRLQAFGEEPPHTLLTSEAVARTSLDVLLSPLTGHVIDVRLEDQMEDESSWPAASPA